MKVLPDSAADLIARLLKRRGVSRVFALCGGHIMPIWMRLDAEGSRSSTSATSVPPYTWRRRMRS